MRILHVTPRYFPNIGGVEIVVQRICESLARSGADVTVYSVDRVPYLAGVQGINGVLVKRFFPMVGDPLFLPEPCFVASLRREKVDVVHIHNIHVLSAFVVALFKRRDSVLVVQPHYHRYGQSHFRESLLKLYRQVVARMVLPQAGIVIANSEYEKKILIEDFPFSKNIVLVPEGIDVDEVRWVKRNPEEPKRILYVGSLKAYKNVDKILEGFAWLLSNQRTLFKLVIVGGPANDFLVKVANDLGVGAYVEWRQSLSRKQLLSEYSRASVLILLSRLESFSRAAYEASLIGIPLVVLNFGALGKLVENGMAEGVNSLSPEEIGKAMLRAYGREFRKVSERRNMFLDWKEYSNRMTAIYERLIGIR